MDQKLAIAVLEHFCWSVMQKQLGRPVAHHSMPIIFSAEQGTGKTAFVKKFLSPLRELATESTLFSDLADRGSGDMFRFAVIFLDDMEQIPRLMVPVLKAVLTSDRLRRRRLGTLLSDGIRQASVPIGTSNQMIHELVKDDTGHRRFAMLPFRNGAVVKGGDAPAAQGQCGINPVSQTRAMGRTLSARCILQLTGSLWRLAVTAVRGIGRHPSG